MSFEYKPLKIKTMKATIKRMKISKVDVMTWAHKFWNLKGKGMFAWTWSQCLVHAWNQMRKLAEHAFMVNARAKVEATATTWVPTAAEAESCHALYHTSNAYNGD